jgi:hypothetical protein
MKDPNSREAIEYAMGFVDGLSKDEKEFIID